MVCQKLCQNSVSWWGSLEESHFCWDDNLGIWTCPLLCVIPRGYLYRWYIHNYAVMHIECV